MIRIYWTEKVENTESAIFKDFSAIELSESLKFAEQLRLRRKAGERIFHIVLSSENEDVVGELGVSDPSPNYSWRKRR